MKFIVLLSALLAGNVFASEPMTVTCSLSYGLAKKLQLPTVGGQVTLRSGDSGTVEVKGFKLNAYLWQVCAADGGPCKDLYDLRTNVSRNGEALSMTAQVASSDSGKKYSAALQQGQEIAYVNCVAD